MIHRPILNEVVQLLEDIFVNHKYADKALENAFHRNRKLGSRDRKQVAELTYDSVRWWRKLWYMACGEKRPSFDRETAWVVLGLLLKSRGQEVPNWVEFANYRKTEKIAESRERELKDSGALEQSYPDWLFEMAEKQLGEKWARWAKLLNEPAPVVLRANRLKATREEVREALIQAGYKVDLAPQTSDGLVLLERKNVFTSEAFQKGLFEVQDGASQHVAPLLELKPGLRVIDACAGAGGKTLHIASLMLNKGRVIALDIHQHKLDELSRRARRAGADIIETRVIDTTKTLKRLEASADRLLLDVPCSGLGVLRRNPDAKWKLSEKRLQELATLQQDLLQRYSKMLKPEGLLVYATCSCLPSENERQVETFVARNREFEIKSMHQMEVGRHGYDGFFAAVIVAK